MRTQDEKTTKTQEIKTRNQELKTKTSRIFPIKTQNTGKFLPKSGNSTKLLTHP